MGPVAFAALAEALEGRSGTWQEAATAKARSRIFPDRSRIFPDRSRIFHSHHDTTDV